MSIDRLVLAFAGIVILAGAALTQLHHANWIWLSVFVGANLLQAAFTKFCPLAMMLKKFGATPGKAFS